MKAKKVIKKVSPRKSLPAGRQARKSALKPIGVVTHFYGKIKVAIIKFKQPVKVGAEIAIRGATTDFKQVIASMQYDHKPLKVAKKGKEVGIKVKKKVHEGDRVFANIRI